MREARLLVEGWRGISHSFALVNQQQLLCWAREPRLQLFHRDLPLLRAHWNSSNHGAGFDEANGARLNSLPVHEGEAVDAVYRIAFPTPRPLRKPGGAPQFSFIVTSYGLEAGDLAPATALHELTQGGNAVITPSAWSRRCLLDSGLDPAGVHVVPHGVNLQTFQPLAAEERRLRRQALGFQDDEFVFVNVGVATWNKGLDHLILAFARLRRRHAGARLVLKNHRPLYGATLDPYFQAIDKLFPGLLNDDVMGSISVIENNLDQAALRELYACADCYVSPYRAEGFNLPVLEALACGTPVVVTGGGATDDFCQGPWASRVSGRVSDAAPQVMRKRALVIEIEPDALLAALQQRLLAPAAERRLCGPAWQAFMQSMSWERVSSLVLDRMLPGRATQAAELADAVGA